jgi:hypothetical protein
VAHIDAEDVGARLEQARMRSGVEEAGPSVARILVFRLRRIYFSPRS